MKHLMSKKHYSYITNEKQCLPPSPFYRHPYMNYPQFLQKKSWDPPLLWFIKNLSSPYKKGNLHYVDMFDELSYLKLTKFLCSTLKMVSFSAKVGGKFFSIFLNLHE